MSEKNWDPKMHEFEIIKKYFSIILTKNKSALNLNDDLFFDKQQCIATPVASFIIIFIENWDLYINS